MKAVYWAWFIILLIYSAYLLAEADGPDFWDVKNVAAGDRLNVREKPDARSKKVGTLVPGQSCVKNLGCTGMLSYNEFISLSETKKTQLKNRHHWCKIQYRDITGWVYSKYIGESTNTCYNQVKEISQ